MLNICTAQVFFLGIMLLFELQGISPEEIKNKEGRFFSHLQLRSFPENIILSKIVKKIKSRRHFCVCARHTKKDNDEQKQVLKCAKIYWALSMLYRHCVKYFSCNILFESYELVSIIILFLLPGNGRYKRFVALLHFTVSLIYTQPI